MLVCGAMTRQLQPHRTFKEVLRIGVIAFATLPSALNAAHPRQGEVVRVDYGISRIDLAGRRSQGMAILANRENFNAHGFDVLSLYIKDSSLPGERPIWSIVPIIDGEKERLEITVGGGADCYLHDFRLVRKAKDQPLQLIQAHRDLGEGFAEPGNVTFTFYELRHNKSGEIGRPIYFFEQVSTLTTEKKYCDVEEAFKVELRLKDYRDKAKE